MRRVGVTKNLVCFTRVLLVLICSLLAFEVFSQEAFTLRVEVDGATANKGQAICGLFTSEDSFLEKPYRGQTLKVNGEGKASFVFTGLKRGTYAVGVIYDEDGNGILNRNFLGIPTESFGASNNAKNRFGPPKFKRAKFELKSNKTIAIHLGKVRN